MSKLKVAICLSGLVGTNSKGGSGETVDFRLAKDSFDKNLINNDIEIDFFLHCWKNNFESEILKLYNPRNYCFEKPLTKKNNYTSKEFGIISNNYSKLKAVELKRKFENKNSLLFDYVILTRFDILISNTLDYKKLNPKNFYVIGPKIHHSKKCNCAFCNEDDPEHCLNDLFFISSSINMDKFSNAYHHLNEYGLKSNHIITKKHLVKMDIYKDIDFIFKLKSNNYPSIWSHLEKIGVFPKGLVAVRIFDTDVPLIRWVYKSKFLKFLDFIIFNSKLDVFYEYMIKIFKFKNFKIYSNKILFYIFR